jgi:hypothetical protein
MPNASLSAFAAFRAGTHTEMNGTSVTISTADLAASARAYDPSKWKAPIVIGHPKVEDPAFGWVEKAEARGDELRVTPQEVDASFAELVRDGRYRNVSASFWKPDAPSNPTPGVWALKHVGFLGAVPPAVKGLSPVAFAAEAGQTIELAAFNADSEAQRLRVTLDNYRLRERQGFIDRMVNEARVPSQDRDFLAAFAEAVHDHAAGDSAVRFSDAGDARTMNLWEAFVRLVSGRPPIVAFGELATEGKNLVRRHGLAGDPQMGIGLTLPPGARVSPGGMELHERAERYRRENQVSYAEAVRAVSNLER